MAGFCSKCGRPLPENGVCPCTMQQPEQQPQFQQQYQQPQYQPQYQQPQYQQPPAQPSAFGIAMKNFPKLLLSYCKDPIGTTRKAVEQKDFLSGIIVMVIAVIATYLTTLVYALRVNRHFPVGAWLLTGLFAPAFACGLTLLATFVLTKVGKVAADFKGLLASTGVGAIAPAALTIVALPLVLISPSFLGFFGVLCFAAWVVVAFATVTQVYDIKLNLASLAILIGFCVVSYYAVASMRDWFVSSCFSYGLRDLLDLF